MSFASKFKGRELTEMVKLISIFGIVETRQMRQMFSHLDEKQYGSILNRLHWEEMIFVSQDAKYLASNRLSAKKADGGISVDCFWTLISIKDRVADICAGVHPALATVSAGGTDCDIIPVTEKTLGQINESCCELPDSVCRLLVMRSAEQTMHIVRRLHNDFAVIVGPNGVTETYEM